MKRDVYFILGLQPRDKAAMLVVKTKEIFLLNLHQNGVHFPAERNAFVLDHQHGRRKDPPFPDDEKITGHFVAGSDALPFRLIVHYLFTLLFVSFNSAERI